MSKKKETEEKTVDAEVKEEEVLTTQNEEDGKALEEEPTIEPTEPIESDMTEDEEPDSPEDEPSQDEKIMAYGTDVRTIGPGYVVVNRAAIVFLAKHLMTPPDLEDFKTLFPSLF